MSPAEAYQVIIRLQQCGRSKDSCHKECEKCNFNVARVAADLTYSYVIEMLKAKDPSLYLSNDIQELIKLEEQNRGNRDVH